MGTPKNEIMIQHNKAKRFLLREFKNDQIRLVQEIEKLTWSTMKKLQAIGLDFDWDIVSGRGRY